MTLKQAVEAFEAGKPVLLVEYRSSMCGMMEWRDKTTGKALKAPKLTHNVELGVLSVLVSERVSEDLIPEQYNPPFKKGQRCVLHVTGFTQEKGSYKASGKLEALN